MTLAMYWQRRILWLFSTVLALGQGGPGFSARDIQARQIPAISTELVYFGTRTKGAEGVVQGAWFDPLSGRFSGLEVKAHIDTPSWILFSPQLATMFVASETGYDGKSQGAVTSYAVDRASGALKFLSRVPSGGGGPAHIALNAPFHALMVSNYGTGHLALIPIGQDGRLRPVASIITDMGSGPNPRQNSPHPHGAAVDPSGRFVLETDLGADRIFIYRLDLNSMKFGIDQTGIVSLPPGSGPRHAVFSRDGQFLYNNNELRSELVAWRWDVKDGTLGRLEIISTRQAGKAGENRAGEVLLSRNGRYLYASNRGDDDIAVYRLDAKTGRASELQRISSAGKDPWALAFDNTGRWLLVANEKSGTVNVFAADPKTGLLTNSYLSIAVPHVSSIAFVKGSYEP